MKGHRSSLPVLPNLAKIIFYDSQAPAISDFGSGQKSPLRSNQISKRLKLLNAKLAESPPRTKRTETDPVLHSSPDQPREPKIRPNLLKLDHHVKTKDLLLPKKSLPKLYTSSMHKKYLEKMTLLKDKYANNCNSSLVNLSERDGGNRVTLRELVLKTEEQLQHSYSIKYLGVKDEGIGVLSRRVPISQLESKIPRSKSSGKTKDGPPATDRVSEIVTIPRKGSHQLRTKEGSPKNSVRESYVSSLKQLNSEESFWDIERKIEKEHQQCDIITELEENKSVESQPKQKQDLVSQQKLIKEMHHLKESLFIKEGYKELTQVPLDFTKISNHVDERSVTEQPDQQKQITLGDATPNDMHTSFIVNKFSVPHKLQSLKKKHISPQKGARPAQMTSERLNREVYMVSNYASFERQVASLHKLKSKMLGIRSKSNARAETVQNVSVVAEIKPLKKEQHRYSYAKLLNTMYTQENTEMDQVGGSILVKNMGKNVADGDSELEKEDSRDNQLENSGKQEVVARREKRSNSQSGLSNRSLKAQLKAQMRNAIKLL